MRILAIGAHPDDVELGCGGSLFAHRAAGDSIALLVMTMGERGPQSLESRVHEQEDAASLLEAQLMWGGLDDGAVPDGPETVGLIDAAVRELEPDVIYTHSPHDTHQDHRATSVATLAAARRTARVLMYEAPTSKQFVPSFFVDITDFLDLKVASIRAHESQVQKNRLVDLEAVAAQARYRGFEARIGHRCAEGFAVDRFVWDLTPAPLATAGMTDIDLGLQAVGEEER